jgi:hypothetical protein
VEQVDLLSRRSVTALVLGTLVASVVMTGQAAGRPSPRVNHAGIVVQHSDLGTLTDCVAFKEPKIDGVKLLDRGRFEYRGARDQFGVGICWIDGEGCNTTNPDECFCTPLVSWSYWIHDEGGLPIDHADTYASGRVVRDGSIDYWTFGPHGTAPVNIYSIDDICGSDANPASAAGRVEHLDPVLSKLVADRVGASEVLGRPRLVALAKKCDELGG